MGDLKSELQRLKNQLSVKASASQKGSNAHLVDVKKDSYAPSSGSISTAKNDWAKYKVTVSKSALPSQVKQVSMRPKIAQRALEPKKLPIRIQTPIVPRVSKQPIKASPTTKPSEVKMHFTSLPKGAPTRREIFREPDYWVRTGGSTQLVTAHHEKHIDVVIGLDFGTSFTKAAVGFLDKIFPVTWEGVSAHKPAFLLPSEYSILEDGSIFLGQHGAASGMAIHGDLKLPFISPSVSTTSIRNASVFLAMVVRYIRAWVFFYHHQKIGAATIRWHLNLGSPSNGLETDFLSRAYKTLAGTAWMQSLCPDPQRVSMDPLYLWAMDQPLLDLSEPEILPEFVGQIAGYMQSSQQQEGLHALIDVGGGTLDIVTFIVRRVDGDGSFPFLVPDVRALGTHGLIQNRLTDAESGAKTVAVDELKPIADAKSFAVDIGVSLQHVEMRDEIFLREVNRSIKQVFDLTKNRRYRLADAWQHGVRTFFTGGGSNVPLYLKAAQAVRISNAQELRLLPLPPHPRLDGFDASSEEYQRVSVACGLALDAFTLGRVIPAREVEDDRPAYLHLATRPDRDDPTGR
jgi:hypothetical protein